MKDITKCTNEDCPLKENCIRWTDEIEEYQSYARFEISENGACDGYWDEE